MPIAEGDPPGKSRRRRPVSFSPRTVNMESVRKGFALLLIGGLAAITVQSYLQWRGIDRGMVIHRLDTETARFASSLFFDKMTAMGQLTIALLGATWALAIAPDTRIKISGFPALACFLLSNTSFILSLVVYNYGYDFIVRRVFHHATFDIDAPLVVMLNSRQQIFFIYGCLSLACTVILGRKEERE